MKKSFYILFVLLINIQVFCQMVSEMEFRDQPVKDILLVLAQVGNKSIILDETVDGFATYSFHNMPFETALMRFLDSQGMFFKEQDDVYYVSRIFSEYNKETSKITVKTEKENIQTLLKIISRSIDKTILYDALPGEEIGLNFIDGDVESLLSIIIKRYTEYNLEKGDSYYYIKRIKSGSGINIYDGAYFNKENDLYSTDLKQVRFRDVLTDLMKKEGKEFSFLGSNDLVLDQFSFSNKEFKIMLDLLVEQSSNGYRVVNDIYYFYDRDKRDILSRFHSSLRVPINYLSADSIIALIPSSITSEVQIKIDPMSNSLFLTGNLNSLSSLEAYIKRLDDDIKGYKWTRFDLVYLDAQKIISLLPEKYSLMDSIVLSDNNSFLLFSDLPTVAALKEYLILIDQPGKVFPIILNYIKGKELIDNLPPFLSEKDIVPSLDGNLVYFIGQEDKYKRLLESLVLIDKPKPQIRYEILVLQLRDADQFEWDFSLSSSITTQGAQSAVTGNLGSVLQLNFDIVSQFGYQFASKLNMALNHSDARVMADTTLFGLSGEKIQFQNTGTSRYHELSYDNDGNVTHGSIKEISTGILIDLEGWVSGDGMITMDITSTISKQSSVNSNSTNALPSTTEKVINTHVRTPSGEPIIITGLKQQDTAMAISKIPFLGDIPLLGLLFQKRQETVENSDFYVTIVPHLVYTEKKEDIELIDYIYNTLVIGYEQNDQ